MKKTIPEAITDALLNKCPNCEEGRIFDTFLKMHSNCPSCGVHFEREPGYFLGAMSFSYLIGFFAVLPQFLYLLFTQLSLLWVVGIPAIQILMMSPFLYRFSRLIWVHLDRRMNPDSHAS